MKNGFQFDWRRMDPEAKLGIPAKKFTGVNSLWAFFLGIVLTILFYGVLFPFWQLKSMQFINMFFPGGAENRSYIPIVTMFFTMWCLAFLLIKNLSLNNS